MHFCIVSSRDFRESSLSHNIAHKEIKTGHLELDSEGEGEIVDVWVKRTSQKFIMLHSTFSLNVVVIHFPRFKIAKYIIC